MPVDSSGVRTESPKPSIQTSMGKIVRCQECSETYRSLERLEDLRDNDGICLVCNAPIEVSDWDRVLASYEEDDLDDVDDVEEIDEIDDDADDPDAWDPDNDDEELDDEDEEDGFQRFTDDEAGDEDEDLDPVDSDQDEP